MPSLSSPTQSMVDIVYPEPMSRLHRRVIPKKRRGGSFRYRTQPVTFSEIQEVDEENVIEESSIPESSATSRSMNLLNEKFEEFKKSRDNEILVASKINEQVEMDESSCRNIPLTTCRSLGKIPSRPSF